MNKSGNPKEKRMSKKTDDILGRKVQTYTGTRDYSGDDARWRVWVIEQIRFSFAAFGFEPLETPAIETERTLMDKYGEEGNRNIFRLRLNPPDAAGLRYDHTVPLARFMAMVGTSITRPYRRYAIGPVFRHESTQRGRLRQFTQCDFDTVGSTSLVIDAEVVAMNYTVLTKLGFKGNFVVRINDRRLLNAMASEMGFTQPEQVLALFRGWDKLEKADRATVQQELEAIKVSPALVARFSEVTDKLLALSEKSSREILEGLRKEFKSPEVKTAVDLVEQLVGYISAMGVPDDCFQVWPLLARGLDYYTGPIFETVVLTSGIGSVTGGGRFDNLIETLGGPSMPASGSSFGLERLMEVMDQIGLKPGSSQTTQVFVTLFDMKDMALCQKSFELAATLRAAGFNVEVFTGEQSRIGKQLDVANRKKIPLVLILGSNELREGKVNIKDLREDKRIPEGQMTVSWEDVTKQVSKLLD
jgi:histidyl-tRNA synthetase